MRRESRRSGMVWADVLMPEHGSLLARPKSRTGDAGRFLAAIKRPVSVRAKQWLERNGRDDWLGRLTVQQGDVFRFWQAGTGSDEHLNAETANEPVAASIPANPMRRGMVQRPTDRKWSPAAWGEDPTADVRFAADRVVL